MTETSDKATVASEEALLRAEVGDCCMGCNPYCAAGCLVEVAVRKRRDAAVGEPATECARLRDELADALGGLQIAQAQVGDLNAWNERLRHDLGVRTGDFQREQGARVAAESECDRLGTINGELLTGLRGLLIDTEPLGIQWWDGQNGGDAYRCRACGCYGDKPEKMPHLADCSRVRVQGLIAKAEKG